MYCHFVAGYTCIAYPLNALLKKDYNGNLDPFNDYQAHAFEMVINADVNPPSLSLLKNGFPFLVDTNSSNYQGRSFLFQIYPGGTKVVEILVVIVKLPRAELLHHGEGMSGCGLSFSNTPPLPTRPLFPCRLRSSNFTLADEHQRPLKRPIRWRLKLFEFDYEIQFPIIKKKFYEAYPQFSEWFLQIILLWSLS